MLSLRHYIIFKTVAETENFTKAAKKLYVTQSAVSHAIRELEEYTHTQLFDRLSRQVRLTLTGRLFLEEITPILQSLEALERRIGFLEQSAPIHIVSSITIATFWLPKVLGKFQKQNPRVPVFVDVVSAQQAMKLLQEGKADFALLEGIKPQEPFISTRFSTYELFIVCAPDYRKKKEPMSLQEFLSESLLFREKGSAIRDVVDSSLLLHGYHAEPLWTSVNSTALMEAAKEGLGIAVLPKALVEPQIQKGHLVTVEVKELELKNDTFIVFHKNKSMTGAMDSLISLMTDQQPKV